MKERSPGFLRWLSGFPSHSPSLALVSLSVIWGVPTLPSFWGGGGVKGENARLLACRVAITCQGIPRPRVSPYTPLLSVTSCMMTKSFPAPTGEMTGETQALLDGWGCLVPLSNLPPIPFTGPTLAPLCTTHVLPACLPCFPPPHCPTTFRDAVSDLFCPENLTPLRTGCWGALNESGSPSGLETQDMQLVHPEWP